MKIFGRMRDRIQARRDPVGFAKRIGVNIRGDVHFYGMSRAMFGTEPWMVTLGDNVWVAANCQFITHEGATVVLRCEDPDLEWSAPITVGNDVAIGTGSVILPGVNVGNRVIIGVRSVVGKDVPDNSIVWGVPARRVGSVDDYFERMKEKSLGIGRLVGAEKDAELRKIYGYTGSTE